MGSADHWWLQHGKLLVELRSDHRRVPSRMIFIEPYDRRFDLKGFGVSGKSGAADACAFAVEIV